MSYIVRYIRFRRDGERERGDFSSGKGFLKSGGGVQWTAPGRETACEGSGHQGSTALGFYTSYAQGWEKVAIPSLLHTSDLSCRILRVLLMVG